MSDIEPNAAPQPVASPKSGPSNALLAVVLVVILAILGGGGWLVYDKVIKSDDSTAALPASVLPASTLAVATVNASPSLSEKLDLLHFIGKFPALKGKVAVGPKDDPRKWVIEQALKSAKCPSLSFAQDFAPWLGNHFALGAIDLGGSSPSPVAALETTDGAAAKAALAKVVACSKSHDFIYTVTGRYVVASDSQAHLDKVVAEAKAHPLSSDPGYTKWTSKVGSDGIVSFYVARAGVSALLAKFSADFGSRAAALKSAVGEFTGLAGSLSAVSDGIQLKMAIGSKTLTGGGTTALGSEVSTLPIDSTLVLGLGVTKGMADQVSKGFVTGLRQGLQAKDGTMPSAAQAKALFKQYTGLAAPEDVTTLLGQAVVLSFGGNAPTDLGTIQSPQQLPLGLKIKGDAGKIRALIAKVEAKIGGTLAQMGIVNKVAGQDYVIATNPSYAHAITDGAGKLGTDPEFKAALPEAAQAQSLFFLRIDSSWRTAILNLMERLGAPNASEVADNTAGLAALGIASWREGDAGMVDMKLTTK
ncbi:MAG: DUF3352 domain-containing protein [Marmoricola sp.]